MSDWIKLIVGFCRMLPIVIFLFFMQVMGWFGNFYFHGNGRSQAALITLLTLSLLALGAWPSRFLKGGGLIGYFLLLAVPLVCGSWLEIFYELPIKPLIAISWIAMLYRGVAGKSTKRG